MVSPELVWLANRSLSTLSICSLWVNCTIKNWLPGAPLGKVAVVWKVATGSTSLFGPTLSFNTCKLSMLSTVAVGLPNWSACRMRYGKTWPKPVEISETVKAPRLAGSPLVPPEHPEKSSRERRASGAPVAVSFEFMAVPFTGRGTAAN